MITQRMAKSAKECAYANSLSLGRMSYLCRSKNMEIHSNGKICELSASTPLQIDATKRY